MGLKLGNEHIDVLRGQRDKQCLRYRVVSNLSVEQSRNHFDRTGTLQICYILSRS